MKEIKTRQNRWRDRPCSWIGKPFTMTVIQIYALTSKSEEAEWLYEDLKHLSELTSPKYDLFIIGDLNAKVGNQETPGVTGKFALGVQNKAVKG